MDFRLYLGLCCLFVLLVRTVSARVLGKGHSSTGEGSYGWCGLRLSVGSLLGLWTGLSSSRARGNLGWHEPGAESRMGYSSAGGPTTHCSGLCGLGLLGRSLLGLSGKAQQQGWGLAGVVGLGKGHRGAKSRKECSSSGRH